MEKKTYVLIEITEEEKKEINERREEFLRDRSRLRKIPVSINEIDVDEWEKAFSIAEPYTKDIMNLFYFYEDGKDFMRVN
jgi:hypothetical protein